MLQFRPARNPAQRGSAGGNDGAGNHPFGQEEQEQQRQDHGSPARGGIFERGFGEGGRAGGKSEERDGFGGEAGGTFSELLFGAGVGDVSGAAERVFRRILQVNMTQGYFI